MRISELSQDVKEKALEYQINETDYFFDKTTDILKDAFNWQNTTERYKYWLNWSCKQPETISPDELAIGFVEWKDKISNQDLMYSSKYAKSNQELLKIYKKEKGL